MNGELADRFRRWYAHERDCNTRIVEMLESVPHERRSGPEFARAMRAATHLIAAREIWLRRLGRSDDEGGYREWFPTPPELSGLAARFAKVETAWSAYLERLDAEELSREFEFGAPERGYWRWNVEGILTQVNGHAWYHRGQIAMLVAASGGKAVDTDYIFWAKPEKIG